MHVRVFFCYVAILTPIFDLILELSLGELVHDEVFGLFEAMSAIEMMDPKMDVGMRNEYKKASFTYF